ncbi:MAG: twin-arginine translocation pathway signal, partial [Amylibacter sp.]
MIITGMIMLVVIVLRGALDVVAPEVDPMLGKYRPNLSKTKHLDLDGFFGLHPGLGDLMLLWKAGEMGFVQAVSTPYRDKRSNFDGQDLLEVGVVEVSSDARDSVWMNCMLDLIPEAKKDMVFSVGRENMLLLRGAFPTTSWA